MTFLACSKSGSNPLLDQPNTPYGVPAFDQVKNEHYLPAFEAAIAENKAEIDAIVNNEAEPTFENTIVALDRAGLLLDRVQGVFFNVLEADGNDEMNAIAEQVSPMLSELSDGIILNDKLFQRVKFVYDQRDQLGLNPEQMRLVTETYKAFADNGANLPEDKKERLKAINQELALLSLQFGNNVVAETNAYQYFVKDEAELKGLPESAKAAAAEEAAAAGHPGEWLFTPKRTSFTPVLQYCENRELRKELLMEAAEAGELTEGLPHVHVCGLMAMASLTDDMEQVAREFDLVRRTYIMLKDGCFDESPYFNHLSMGMSDDWKVAVKYGATLVRIGTAIFGPRKY